jgi:Flp pilus assembly protein TadG
MSRSWGQALVEFAIILPLILLLILGSVQVGEALIVRYDLGHAVIEGADTGAGVRGVPNECKAALAALAEVYGRPTYNATCKSTKGLIEVGATADLRLLLNLGGAVCHTDPGSRCWPIRVTARSEVDHNR